MSVRPSFAMIVSDITASLKFYISYLGFIAVESQLESGMATMLDSDGDPILLADHAISDVKSYLDEPRIVFKLGDTLDFSSDDLDAQKSLLVERGLTDLTVAENAWGDRTLLVKDPDGYVIAFVSMAHHSPEELLVLYERAPEELESALAGLSEAELDLRRADNEWTIRQIVHHLAESATLFVLQIKTALAQSGSIYIHNPYDQDHWVQSLDYAGRPIEPSLALIKAVHAHIAQLLHHIPDYQDRYVLSKLPGESPDKEGRKTTVGELLGILVRHTTEHCEEIRETRRII